ncbi:hypothetical protein ACWY4P_01390 [Streptomyces sp. LZ34]
MYVDAFCAPPWHEDEDEEKAVEFAERLPQNVQRLGFTAPPVVPSES